MKCLVLMPFHKDFDEVYAVIKLAVESSVPGELVECSDWMIESLQGRFLKN